MLQYILNILKEYKGSFPKNKQTKGRIIMKEKERVKEMEGLIAMEKAEEAKREQEQDGVEATVKKEEEEYNAKINKMENEILEEQDRVGALGKSS
jgi:adenine specific DNA methylase Mod